jgi:hypothetical protein
MAKPQAILDDDTHTDDADIADRLRTALSHLKSIATTGDVAIDEEMMNAEQAARRALIAINKRRGKYK